MVASREIFVIKSVGSEMFVWDRTGQGTQEDGRKGLIITTTTRGPRLQVTLTALLGSLRVTPHCQTWPDLGRTSELQIKF